MDQRFVRVWNAVEAQRQAGEALPQIIGRMRTRDLIAALAGVGQGDAVASNVIATELLNRQARAPFLGAALVGAGLAIATFVVDVLLTSSPLLQLTPSVARGYIIAGLGALCAVFSGIMYATWRGRLPMLRRLVHGVGRRGGGAF